MFVFVIPHDVPLGKKNHNVLLQKTESNSFSFLYEELVLLF